MHNSKIDLNLSGKTALVCGSTRGIGLAIARQLAELGASIILCARNEARLKASAAELPSEADQNHSFISADFSDPQALEVSISRTLEQGLTPEILVNNTGGPPAGPIAEATPEQFELAFRQHIICAQLLSRSLIPVMKDRGYGRIVNIISTSVKQPIPGLGVSNTIRGAMASWSKTLAGELGPLGITVNNVLPGFTDTQRLQSLIAKRAENSGRSHESVRQDMIDSVPLKRMADAREIASAVGFLVSPAAAYISGINLPVDGGRLACL